MNIVEIYKKAIAYASLEENACKNMFFLIAGLIIGLFLTFFIIKILPVSMAPIENAKQLGIVSKTILDNYPKHQETVYYIIGLFVTVGCAVLFWFLWAMLSSKKYNGIADVPGSKQESRSLNSITSSGKWKIFDYILLPLVILLLTFNSNFFYNLKSSWGFLSEEGLNLGAVNSILHGKVLYRDVYYVYGPLLEYPLALIMKIFGCDILYLRIYTYALTFIGFLIIYYSLKMLLNKRTTLFILTAIIVLFYFPFYSNSSSTIFRTVIGLTPLFLMGLYFVSEKQKYMLYAGIISGISTFFSQEVGIVGTASVIIAVGIGSLGIQYKFKKIAGSIFLFICGWLVVAVPIITYFGLHNALPSIIDNLISSPKYMMMGCGGLPFPKLFGKENSFFVTFTVYYWPILIYICTSIYLIFRFLTNKWNKKDILMFSVLVFGIMFFRSALARTDDGKTLQCLPPILILAAVYSEELICGFIELIKKGNRARIRYELMLKITTIVLILIGLIGFAVNPAKKHIKEFVKSNLNKIHIIKPGDTVTLDIERARKITVPKIHENYAVWLREVVNYIKSHTTSNDYIYVFPNEATFYFLTDRLNPTRFDLSNMVVTPAHRIEVVKNLEEKNPKYIIYSFNTWRVDDIPETIYAPEITKYIISNYVLEKDFQGLKILRRKS